VLTVDKSCCKDIVVETCCKEALFDGYLAFRTMFSRAVPHALFENTEDDGTIVSEESLAWMIPVAS
jgi:hypothetical protein